MQIYPPRTTFLLYIFIFSFFCTTTLSATHGNKLDDIRQQLSLLYNSPQKEMLDGARKAMEQAKATNNNGTVTQTAILCAQLALNQHCYDTAEYFISDAMAIGDTADMAQASLNYWHGQCLVQSGKPQLAIDAFSKALTLTPKSGTDTISCYTLFNLGKCYWTLRQYTPALNNFDKAYDKAAKPTNDNLRLQILLYKGLVLAQIANYPKAIETDLLANELALQQNNAKLTAASLNQVGNIYLLVGQPAKAQIAFNESMVIYQKINDSLGISQSLSKLAAVHAQMGSTSQAIDFAQKSLRLNEKSGDTLAICASKLTIGQIEFKSGQFQQAIKQYLQAMDFMSNQNDESLLASLQFNMGQALLATGNTGSAIDYLRSASQLARKLGERNLKANCYNTLSSAYEQKGDFANALKLKNEFALLKDSILNEQTIEYVARMDAIYRSLQKEDIIKSLKAQNADASKTLAKEKVAKIGLGIAIAFLTIISIILLAAFRYTRKSRQKLTQANKELAHLNAAKDKFFSIISHDLKSPINSIMGFSEMITLHAEAGHTEKLVEFAHMVHGSTKKLYNLVENLLLWSRTQFGSTNYQPQQIDVAIQCQNIMALLRLGAEEKDIWVTGKLEKNLMAFADINLFNTVLRNLISNAIKFSPIGSTISVSTKKQNNHIVVSVSDTGVGIPREHLEKLFSIDTNISTAGTFNEKGSGLGLILCKEFVEINKGTINVESEQGKGSVFYFTVPLAMQ